MPAYKDEKTGTWYCRFYYKDYTGKRKQKMKRGFQLQREAKQWEADFLTKMSGSPEMPFSELYTLYLEDRKPKIKPTTYKNIETAGRLHFIPWFGNRQVNMIETKDVQQWQNSLLCPGSADGEPFKAQTVQKYTNTLSSVFNFAVDLYGLQENPCKRLRGSIKKQPRKIRFWTKEEFDRFINTYSPHSPMYTAFMVLYYTGIRKGELQALTPADIDLDNGIIHITKALVRIKGQDIIQTPKTEKSIRDITIPAVICDLIREYENRFYDLEDNDQIFKYYGSAYNKSIKSHAERAGLKPISVHDLRHSHASLLIDLGFPVLLVSERLGHENIAMTLNTYSHLFPSKQNEVADRLQKMLE